MASKRILSKKRAKRPAKTTNAVLAVSPAEKPTRFVGTLDEVKQVADALRTHEQAKDAKPKVQPFEEGEVNAEASLWTLVRAMFESPNARKTGHKSVDFLTSVMLSTADDLAIIAGLDNGLDNADLVDRATLRADWRLRFAAEIARRLESGQGVDR